MRRALPGAQRGPEPVTRTAGRRAADRTSGEPARSRRSVFLARWRLLPLAPCWALQVLCGDRCLVDIVVRGALDVDRVDVLVLELARLRIALGALDVVVEAAIGLGL